MHVGLGPRLVTTGHKFVQLTTIHMFKQLLKHCNFRPPRFPSSASWDAETAWNCLVAYPKMMQLEFVTFHGTKSKSMRISVETDIELGDLDLNLHCSSHSESYGVKLSKNQCGQIHGYGACRATALSAWFFCVFDFVFNSHPIICNVLVHVDAPKVL